MPFINPEAQLARYQALAVNQVPKAEKIGDALLDFGSIYLSNKKKQADEQAKKDAEQAKQDAALRAAALGGAVKEGSLGVKGNADQNVPLNPGEFDVGGIRFGQGAGKPDKMADYRNASLDLRKQGQALQVSNRVNTNPNVQTLTQKIQQIGLDKHTLSDPNTPITAPMVHELGQGLANALGGGKSAGLQQSVMQTVETAQGDVAKFEDYITGHPHEALPPAMRQQYLNVLDRIGNGFEQMRQAHVTKLTGSLGAATSNNRYAKNVLDQASKDYAYTPPPQPISKEVAYQNWLQQQAAKNKAPLAPGVARSPIVPLNPALGSNGH